jgi:hypothetical protein
MLDEEEFAIVGKLYSEGMSATQEFRLKHNLPLSECSIEERFRPVRDACERMTGIAESSHNAIIHHRISIYGPPCESCGKPLRTRHRRTSARRVGRCVIPTNGRHNNGIQRTRNKLGTLSLFINNTKFQRWVPELTRQMCQRCF